MESTQHGAGNVFRELAADLALELGESVTWEPAGFVVRGTLVSSPAAVRAVAGADPASIHPREAATLARIIRRWGDRYWISYSANLYHAERRDNGARTHAAHAAALERLVEEDYLARPWPPGEPPVITERTAWKSPQHRAAGAFC